jgi:predicted amidohydrolase
MRIFRYARADSDLWTLAPEAGAYVILWAGQFTRDDYPERYRPLMGGWQFTGDSSIIDPRGEVIAGPAVGETILTARVTLEAVYAAKVASHAGGHYARGDTGNGAEHGIPAHSVLSPNEVPRDA